MMRVKQLTIPISVDSDVRIQYPESLTKLDFDYLIDVLNKYAPRICVSEVSTVETKEPGNSKTYVYREDLNGAIGVAFGIEVPDWCPILEGCGTPEFVSQILRAIVNNRKSTDEEIAGIFTSNEVEKNKFIEHVRVLKSNFSNEISELKKLHSAAVREWFSVALGLWKENRGKK